ncbi:MAG: hypothetical protein HYU64_03875 [Armatimonadetes bacterium]|nr:hypothetical protein [Armatimonadota bacterium]
MSSFDDSHNFYLFAMKSGKRKLGYGSNPEDAYETLRFRLTPQEMEEIIKHQCLKIHHRKLRDYIHELG